MKTPLETTLEEGLNALQEQQFSKAEPLLRRALQNAQESKNELLAAKCLDAIGEISFLQGAFAQAEPYFAQALDIRQKNIPSSHEDIIASLNNLSAAYFFQGKYKEAKPLCQQLIATYETVLGAEHPEIATCLINLGLIAMAEGQLENAEQYFAKANKIRQSNYEPTNILIGNSLSHLGNAYFEQKHYEQASQKFKEALVILEAHHSPGNPDLKSVLIKLIQSFEEINNISELEQFYPKLISSTEIELGPAHPEVIKHLDKLANLYVKQNKYEEAEKIFQRLLAMKRRAWGEAHPEVARQLTHLAFIKQALGNAAQAEALLLQAINLYESYRTKSPTSQVPTLLQYLEAIKNLAIFYDRDKRYAKSEKQWQHLLQLCEAQPKAQTKLLLDGYEYFAVSLIEQKKLVEAQLLLKKALSFLGDNEVVAKLDQADLKIRQPRIITKLAHALKADHQYNEAEAHYKDALDMLMKSLGPDHPSLIDTLEGYADLFMITYREPEAEHMLSCARVLSQKTGKKTPLQY